MQENAHGDVRFGSVTGGLSRNLACPGSLTAPSRTERWPGAGPDGKCSIGPGMSSPANSDQLVSPDPILWVLT